ncbi:MAG: Dicamba O-demethylase 2, ferredoxin reductase component [Chlamydiales bacterium]|nr:Dicamba O-demethylase 2, ferredoxin reductase component [Chlamydiales bacterium]
MEEYTYLIVGGGMAADAAARGIRELDASGRIGIVSEEKHPPYDRPPLSKGLWIGKKEEEIWRHTEQENVSFLLEKKVVAINPEAHQVTDSTGEVYGYKKLLLATGGSPRRLNCLDEGVIYFRTLDDYFALRALYDTGDHFVVIGSGYIGTEIAASLAMNGKQVTMIFREPSLESKKLPSSFSEFLTTYYQEKGVKLLTEQTVTSVTQESGKSVVKTSDGQTLYADGVVAGLGIIPSTELADSCGLKIENGVFVNRMLQTSHPDIFSAGDVTNFYSPHLEKRMRCEHEDAANTLGRTAGRNMAGAAEEYNHLPYFYSDLFEIGYEAIGEISSDMVIVEDSDDSFQKGILYYLREGRVKGAFLWGIWNQTDRVRELIAAKEFVHPESLVGLITH